MSMKIELLPPKLHVRCAVKDSPESQPYTNHTSACRWTCKQSPTVPPKTHLKQQQLKTFQKTTKTRDRKTSKLLCAYLDGKVTGGIGLSSGAGQPFDSSWTIFSPLNMAVAPEFLRERHQRHVKYCAEQRTQTQTFCICPPSHALHSSSLLRANNNFVDGKSLHEVCTGYVQATKLWRPHHRKHVTFTLLHSRFGGKSLVTLRKCERSLA